MVWSFFQTQPEATSPEEEAAQPHTKSNEVKQHFQLETAVSDLSSPGEAPKLSESEDELKRFQDEIELEQLAVPSDEGGFPKSEESAQEADPLTCETRLEEPEEGTQPNKSKEVQEPSIPREGTPEETFMEEADQPAKEKRPIMDCDYDKGDVPELFKKIEAKEWDDVINFLDTGSWPGFSLLPDCIDPKTQTMTIVTRYNHALGDPRGIKFSRSPLQQAVMLNAPYAVVRRLVELWPASVRWANRDGQLAIHLAMLFRAKNDVIAYLLIKNPESINAKTNLGFTPLQAALKAGNRSRGLMLTVFLHYTKLSKVVPHVAMAPDKALHCDYEENCSYLYKKLEEGEWDEITKFFDTGVWKSASIFGGWGGRDKVTPELAAQTWVSRYDKEDLHPIIWSQLPLHVAIIAGAPFKVTRRLIELYPKACLHTDDQGMLPLHLALYHGATDDLVAKLLLTYPDAVNKKSVRGYTPLDCALQRENKVRGKILEMFLAKMTSKNAEMAMDKIDMHEEGPTFTDLTMDKIDIHEEGPFYSDLLESSPPHKAE